MHFLCATGDVSEGVARSFSLNDQKFIVVKVDLALFVYLNQCPHLRIPLEWLEDDFMDPDGVLLRCSTHGALFLPESGECVAGPCAGQYLQPIQFVIHENGVWII